MSISYDDNHYITGTFNWYAVIQVNLNENIVVTLIPFDYFIIICVASTEKDIDTRLTKAWTAINRLTIIWKSDLTDKMKRSFFQAAVVSILLYGCTTWTLTKRLEKKVDGNLEQVLGATPHKAPTVRPPSSYHKNYSG